MEFFRFHPGLISDDCKIATPALILLQITGLYNSVPAYCEMERA